MIVKWKEFLQTPYGQTPYGQTHVPEWFDKLQSVIQSNQEPDVRTCEVQNNTHEEWMIISDLNISFQNSEETPEFTHNCQQDRANYSDQQISEMPLWIKNSKKVIQFKNSMKM